MTFTHATDIRNVCAQLGALKVNDWQLACSVNRDLTRRVKHVSSITWSRRAVHSDLHQAIALVRYSVMCEEFPPLICGWQVFR